MEAMKITIMAPWSRQQVLTYAIGLVRNGTLSIDEEGRIWRHFVGTKTGRKPIEAKRAENSTRKGYLALTLGVPGTRKTCKVFAHILVWVWLKGAIPAGLQVNHKDTCKQNNRPDNLELTTGSENIQHSYANGRPRPWHKATEWRPGVPRLSEEAKARVLELRAQGMGSYRISKATGISKTHVERIIRKGGAR
jgi:hypothetical protein